MAVEANKKAFEWGRVAVADPGAFAAHTTTAPPAQRGDTTVPGQVLVGVTITGATRDLLERRAAVVERDAVEHDEGAGVDALLPRLATANLPLACDIVLAARSGDLKDAGNAFATAIKRLAGNKVDGEELASMLGIISQDSVLEAMGVAYGTAHMSGRMRSINRVFFKYNGMQGWNNSMRIALMCCIYASIY